MLNLIYLYGIYYNHGCERSPEILHVGHMFVECWVNGASDGTTLKVIYHPLYSMINYVLIWGDWLTCDPLRGSHDSQSPHISKHLCPILWQL